MSFCGWSSGEQYKNHFEPGKSGDPKTAVDTDTNFCVTFPTLSKSVKAVCKPFPYFFSLPGVYACSKCGAELFHSTKKFEHSSPWPAFTETVTPDCLSKRQESTSALKVSCAKCGNGLGHEFLNDGPNAAQSRF